MTKRILTGLAVAQAMAAMAAIPAGARTVAHGRAHDNLMTFDAQTRDSAGAFLVGELERLDPTLNMPLVDVSWGRDIQLREDVTIADEQSSFTNSSFAAAGGASGAGKSWIGKDSTTIRGLALDIAKTSAPLALWGMELGWTIPELVAAQRLGRPVDTQKYEGMQLKYQMDIDEQVYVGDDVIGVGGLVNHAAVPVMNVPTGAWSDVVNTTPDEILADVNAVLTESWKNTGYAIAPAKLLLDPIRFGILVSRRLTDTGETVLDFVKRSCISAAKNGKPLDIQPCKWLEGRGVGGTNRMVAYTNDKRRVRFPLVPLQRTPMESRGLLQLTNYYGRLGAVEFVYEETAIYADGL